MGSLGDCYDNAMMESFWSRMQVELVDRKSWRTRVELANLIFEYLEILWKRSGLTSSRRMPAHRVNHLAEAPLAALFPRNHG